MDFLYIFKVEWIGLPNDLDGVSCYFICIVLHIYIYIYIYIYTHTHK